MRRKDRVAAGRRLAAPGACPLPLWPCFWAPRGIRSKVAGWSRGISAAQALRSHQGLASASSASAALKLGDMSALQE